MTRFFWLEAYCGKATIADNWTAIDTQKFRTEGAAIAGRAGADPTEPNGQTETHL